MLNGIYWVVDLSYKAGVRLVNWANDNIDNLAYECGDCFETEAEARVAAEKVKGLLLSLHEPVTDCNQLPKLTAEVFDHPDCPGWAKWAAVDMNGIAHYFDEKPYPMDTFFYNSRAHHWMVDGDFDASDWQNSLIERTVDYLPKLTAEVFDRPDCPEWAKYAAVDAACLAHWYQYPPTADERAGAWSCLNNKRKVIDQYFNRSNWKNSLIKRPSKDLLKLTTDVFNHPDCPEWANWAAVDKTGCAYYYSDSPVCKSAYWEYDYHQPASRYEHRCEIGRFDASDWRNSLIERPCKLPDWCMVDNICWHKRCGYFTVTYIDDVSKRVDIRQVEDRSKGYLSFHTVCNEVVQARFRPYKANELKAMVGKSITLRDGSVCLCTAWSEQYNHIILDNKGWTAEKLLNAGYAIGDKPCGVFEHLNEKGEWVE